MSDEEDNSHRKGCGKSMKGKQNGASSRNSKGSNKVSSEQQQVIKDANDAKKREMSFNTKGIQEILRGADSAKEEQSLILVNIELVNKIFLAPCYSKPEGRNSTSG